jgi:hypothetical protein
VIGEKAAKDVEIGGSPRLFTLPLDRQQFFHRIEGVDMSHAKPIAIGHWVARIIAAGILIVGAAPKFTGGAAALAEKLPGGDAAATAIGVAEIVAVVLMFVPKTTLIGSALAAVIMLGAIGSHLVGPVGMEGEMASMFGMAVVAFLAAAAATGLAWKRGGGIVPRGTQPAAAS